MLHEFTAGLLLCMKRGGMTVADLKHFFDRPYPTVRLWVYEQRVPRGPSGDKAIGALQVLARRVKGGFVVSPDLSSRARPTAMKELRRDCDRRAVSKACSS